MQIKLIVISIFLLLGLAVAGYAATSFIRLRRMRSSKSAEAPALRFNIAQVSINDHKAIFEEVILALQGAFRDLNLPCTRSENEFADDAINIVIGSVMFVSEPLAEMLAGKRYIVYQMEQLAGDRGHLPNFPAYLKVLQNALAVWDYSATNITQLTAMGIPASVHVPVGFHEALEVIRHEQVRDIDVLFYGALSPRREAVLNQLSAQGARTQALFGVYREERDAMIGRAKILLNIHAMEINTLEEVRLSYLLNNRCFVISENSDHNPYGDGAVFAPYSDLAQTCLNYLKDDAARRQIADQGYQAIRKLDFTAYVGKAVAELKTV